MILSSRMQAVADMVTEGYPVCDIGTDHAYIPVWLAVNRICPRIIAMDIGEGPLTSARANVIKYNVSDTVELRISDGFSAIRPGEVRSAIISGMGGILMNRILNLGKTAADSMDELILSPHSDIDKVRSFILSSGFMISDEKMVIDDGKFYTVMKAVHGHESAYSEEELLYGRILIGRRDDVLRKYIDKEDRKYSQVLESLKDNETEKSLRRKKEVEHRLDLIRSVHKKLDK